MVLFILINMNLIDKYKDVIECGRGWHPLLIPILEYVEKYNNEHEDKLEIEQIKEKFSTLRIYTNYSIPELEDLIDKAEDLSDITCEMCGSTKDVGKTFGWITTICQECAQELANKKDTEFKWKKDGIIYIIKPKKGN